MRKRGLGIMPDGIPEEKQTELVNLVWDAPEADVLTIGPVFEYQREWFPEVMPRSDGLCVASDGRRLARPHCTANWPLLPAW